MRRAMKFSYWLSAVLIGAAMTLPVPARAQDEGIVRVSLIEGEVQVSGRDLPDWSDASINMPLSEEDRLWVPDGGKAELQVRGGVYVRLDEQSSLDVLSLANGSVQFYLDSGHAYVNKLRGGLKVIQLDTPLSSVRTYDNSVMTLDVSEDGATEVSVLKGYAYAESRSGSTRVSAGNTLTIREDGSADVSPLGSPDDWERWNTDRDKQLLAWGESGRYLPDELHEYSSDFDANGRWVYVSEYGYCWTPVITIVDWAPYTVGRWVWIRGNYVWISYEPWGWAPYHFGRWVFITPFGWCWVPPAAGAVYWGPGFVGWVVTPVYIGWVPLAPGELYYGYGYFGPGSVNITNVNINTIVINRNYKNVRVKNSVTIINREDLHQGRWKPVKADRDNPFIERRHEKEEFVPPRVKPERQRLRPEPIGPREVKIPRELEKRKGRASAEKPEPRAPEPSPGVGTPERKRPPERVMKTKPEEVRTRRRLVKERDASAFKPERPADLPVRQMKEPREIIRKPAKQTPEPQQKMQKQKKKETGKSKPERD